jgi:hypothetical protein
MCLETQKEKDNFGDVGRKIIYEINRTEILCTVAN